jgi:hypothetical protein
MRALNSAVALAMFATSAVAQPTAPPATKKPSHDAALLDVDARVKECMRQWDRSTHMTKQEWEVTCRRVANERVKHLRE